MTVRSNLAVLGIIVRKYEVETGTMIEITKNSDGVKDAANVASVTSETEVENPAGGNMAVMATEQLDFENQDSDESFETGGE